MKEIDLEELRKSLFEKSVEEQAMELKEEITRASKQFDPYKIKEEKWPITINDKKRIRVNNNYKCFMIAPNINYWYDDSRHTLFIGWLFWGFDILIKQ